MTPEEEQYLIDVFSEYYSQEDIFAIGRWMGIDSSKYYGFGMNGVQLAQAFLKYVRDNGKEDELFAVIARKQQYYREQLSMFLPVLSSNEVRLGKELHAIIIGINEYQMEGGLHDLAYAENDAVELANFLNEKWNVSRDNIHLFVENTTCDYLASAIKVICESLDERDHLLFYFSGHGMELHGHSYLVTTDAGCTPDGGWYNLLPLGWLNQVIKHCKASVKVRMFDACQCGEKFTKGVKSSLSDTVTGKMTNKMMEEFIGAGNNWITFCSCNIDEYSAEVPSIEHGLFTYFLLQGLNGAAKYGRKKMQIEDLKQYICENVPKISTENFGREQNPQYQCEMQVNVIVE